jgi:hypothetical protein
MGNLIDAFNGKLLPTMPFAICAKISFERAGLKSIDNNLIYVLRNSEGGLIWDCQPDLSDGARFKINSKNTTLLYSDNQYKEYNIDLSFLTGSLFSSSLNVANFPSQFFNIPLRGFKSSDIISPVGASPKNGLFCQSTTLYPNSNVLNVPSTLFLIPLKSYTYGNVPKNLNPEFDGFFYLSSWVYAPSYFVSENSWLENNCGPSGNEECLNQFADPTQAIYGYWFTQNPCNETCANGTECLRNIFEPFGSSNLSSVYTCQDPLTHGNGEIGISGREGAQGPVGHAGLPGRKGDKGEPGRVFPKVLWGSKSTWLVTLITVSSGLVLLFLTLYHYLNKSL